MVFCRITNDYVQIDMRGMFIKKIRDFSAINFEPKEFVDKVMFE